AAGMLQQNGDQAARPLEFLLHFVPMSIVLTLFAFFWRATATFRPHDAKLLGWEGLAFIFLRWPWSLAGSLAAVRDYICG
ncbi:hypothetical protein AB9E34_33925, partial [Rhizobium leguminosarum]